MIAPADPSSNETEPTASAPMQVPSWLVGLVLLAVVWHGAIGFLAPDHELTPDEAEYLALAESLAAGEGFVLPTGDYAKRMPLYPWLLSHLRGEQEFSEWRSTIDLVQSGMAAWGTIAWACCAGLLAGRRAGILAGLIAALYGPFAFLQTQYLTETLTIALLATALAIYLAYAVADGRTRNTRTMALVGVSLLIGLATLARANMLVALFPFAIDFALRRRLNGRFVGALALLLPAGLMLASWAYRNDQQVGKFTLSTIGGLNFYLGNNPDYAADAGVASADYQRFDRLRADGLSEVEADRALYAEAWSFIRNQPSTALANVGRKLVTFITPTTQRFGPVLFVLVTVLPAYVLWLRRKRTVDAPNPSKTAPILARGVWIATALALAWLIYWVYAQLSAQAAAGAGVGMPPPYIAPHYLLPLGALALVLSRFEFQTRRLLVGIFLAQLAVALIFIPLSRIRWTVDGVLIIALAVGVVQFCDYLRQPMREA